MVALKQLLRESHKQRTSLVVPRPSTAGFQDKPEMRNAGVVPLKSKQLKELDTRYIYIGLSYMVNLPHLSLDPGRIYSISSSTKPSMSITRNGEEYIIIAFPFIAS